MNDTIISEFEKLIQQINSDLNSATSNIDRNKHMFRLRQIKGALKKIKAHSTIITRGSDLKDVKGVGKGTIARIDEILLTGKLAEIKSDTQQKILDNAVKELSEVINIGPVKARDLAKQGILTVKQLRKEHKKGTIKLNDKILLGLKYHGKYSQEIPRSEMDKINEFIQKELKKVDPHLIGIVCGSYRRMKLISHDIDLMLVHPDIKKKKDIQLNSDNYLVKLVNRLKKSKFLVDDLTDKNVASKYMGFSRLVIGKKKYPIRRFDIFHVPMESYYTSLVAFTGSGELNRIMRTKAIDMGYKLSDQGLFEKVGDDEYKMIKVKSERHLFELLSLDYIEPHNR